MYLNAILKLYSHTMEDSIISSSYTGDSKRLNAFKMDMYRRMMRISWREHRTNNSIIEELQPTCRFLAEVKRRKLQYFGHVVRADNLCTQFYMVPLPETDVEEDHGDAGLMISNNGQEYP